jgi:hypothetical protein
VPPAADHRGERFFSAAAAVKACLSNISNMPWNLSNAASGAIVRAIGFSPSAAILVSVLPPVRVLPGMYFQHQPIVIWFESSRVFTVGE